MRVQCPVTSGGTACQRSLLENVVRGRTGSRISKLWVEGCGIECKEQRYPHPAAGSVQQLQQHV